MLPIASFFSFFSFFSYLMVNSRWWCNVKRIDAKSSRIRPRNSFPTSRSSRFDHFFWVARCGHRSPTRWSERSPRSPSPAGIPGKPSWCRRRSRSPLEIYNSGKSKIKLRIMPRWIPSLDRINSVNNFPTLFDSFGKGWYTCANKGHFIAIFRPCCKKSPLPWLKYLHACQINTPPCKKCPSSLF